MEQQSRPPGEESDLSSPAVSGPTVLSGPNPFNIAPEADFLAPPRPDVPLWQQSMFFQFVDPSGYAVRTHAGTKVDDQTMWRGLFILYLPDGESLFVSRSFGRASDTRGPDAGLVHFKVEEPLRRWHVRFDGPAERISRLDAARRLVGAGPTEALEVDLVFEARTPVWDMFAFLGLDQQAWGHFHHQQAFDVTGSVTFGGTTTAVSGYGYRDHSQGGRDLGGYGGNHFINVEYPSGRVIQGIQAFNRKGDYSFRTGYLFEGGTFHKLEVVSLPTLSDTGGGPSDFSAHWKLDGREVSIAGRALHHGPMTISDPHDRSMGVNLELDDPLVIVESPVQATAPDGEIGYGMLERNQRLSTLRVP